MEHDNRSIADVLNTTLLGASVSEDIHALDSRIEASRRALRDLMLQRQRMASRSITTVTDRAVAGFLKSVNDCDVSIDNDRVSGSRISVSYYNAPIRFHVMHGRYALGNNNVLYVTLPLYAFTAGIMRNGSASLSNNSYVSMYDSLASGVEGNSFSHPHVGHTGERGASFHSICVGTNKFLDDIDKNITPSSFLEFARRFHIWATHANLNDMYDSVAYKNPKLTQQARAILADSDRLFTLAQKSLSSESDVVELIRAVNDAGLHAESHCEAFIRAYAAWFLNNAPDLSNAYGYLNRRSLLSAARLDLVAEISADAYNYSAIDKEVFGAPAALKALILHEEHENGSSPYRRRLLDKFII